jgi:ADP-L-glycero-D-manno-heptose 6-epimerase
MIAITGAGGFVGSVLVGYLNQQGIDNVVLFDDLPTGNQFKNLVGKKYISLHSTEEIFSDPLGLKMVIHLGADTDTTQRSWSSLYQTNILSTRKWNDFCRHANIPFIFASSAAIYGNGDGPLNHYAFSKLQSDTEVFGVVLRLFNVYGPNEYHKGRMASTIYHWYNQIHTDSKITIFENSNTYRRDFIWVEDVVKTIYHFVENYTPGIYDLGTGASVDFDSIANIVIAECGHGVKSTTSMPDDLRAQYQLDTKADTAKLELAGVDTDLFYEPWQGIKEYCRYLKTSSFY